MADPMSIAAQQVSDLCSRLRAVNPTRHIKTLIVEATATIQHQRVEIERLQAREKLLLERHTGCGCDDHCPVCEEKGYT